MSVNRVFKSDYEFIGDLLQISITWRTKREDKTKLFFQERCFQAFFDRTVQRVGDGDVSVR